MFRASWEAIPQPLKITADVTAAGVAVSAFLQYLPALASVMSIFWILLQMWFFIKDRWNKKD